MWIKKNSHFGKGSLCRAFMAEAHINLNSKGFFLFCWCAFSICFSSEDYGRTFPRLCKRKFCFDPAKASFCSTPEKYNAPFSAVALFFLQFNVRKRTDKRMQAGRHSLNFFSGFTHLVQNCPLKGLSDVFLSHLPYCNIHFEVCKLFVNCHLKRKIVSSSVKNTRQFQQKLK